MRRGIWGAVAFAVSAWLAPAQTRLDAWDNLRQLRAGQEIEVVDMRMKSVRGQFAHVSDEVLSLRVGKDEISVPRASVLSVKHRGKSRRGRNALLGLAIGAGTGLAVAAITGAAYHEEGETGVFALVFTPIGAGAGAALGAALPAGDVTVYRANAVTK